MSLIPRIMVLIPFGIGMTVLIGLWGGGMGDPPLFFRMFGSFIALAFVLFGIAAFKAAGKFGDPLSMVRSMQEIAKELEANQPGSRSGSVSSTEETKSKVGYECPNCAASLGTDADVSPSGDVRCGYCDRWFNIHSEG